MGAHAATSAGAIQLACGSVGVVSHRSPVAALVSRNAVSLAPTASLREAALAMEAAGVSALLIEGGGIITERDIARAVARDLGGDEPVDRVATRNLVVVPGSTTVVDACALMLNEQVRHLVVDIGDAAGVVSLRDMAAVLLQNAEPGFWLASLRVAIDVPTETWLG